MFPCCVKPDVPWHPDSWPCECGGHGHLPHRAQPGAPGDFGKAGPQTLAGQGHLTGMTSHTCWPSLCLPREPRTQPFCPGWGLCAAQFPVCVWMGGISLCWFLTVRNVMLQPILFSMFLLLADFLGQAVAFASSSCDPMESRSLNVVHQSTWLCVSPWET